jgi:hypothetical protein
MMVILQIKLGIENEFIKKQIQFESNKLSLKDIEIYFNALTKFI